MTLTTPYSATFIVGDGETKVFPYLFEEVSENFIFVMVYDSTTGLTTIPTYVVDTDQKQIIFGDETPAPTADETVCIYRNTPNVQDVAFRTLHGYDAKTLENILSKIVAMIQEIKSNYFTTQVLQGDPWQLDLLSSEDDGATVNIDYTAKKLVKGLYFRITDGNLQVSGDGSSYITMPKSADVAEFRQQHIVYPDLTTDDYLEYRIGNQWFPVTADFDTKRELLNHISDTNNPHQVTKDQVGLGNCDNTADDDKPISSATQDALDDLQDEIDSLKGIGRFLSIWNCATGLAETNPPESPYEYATGDYFLVGTVDSTTNYKPNGSSYTTGVASTTVETNVVKINDVYVYDGTTWKLQENSQRDVVFAGIQGSPYDNTALGNALNSKVDETSTAGQVYATDGSGNQTTLAYGTSNTGSALVQRSAAGQVQVPNTPTATTHATSKKYVDDGLADKVDKSNTATVVYGTTGSGNQTTLSYGAAVTDLILVRRPVGGYISVPETPTDDAHATSKKYVDTAVSNKQNTLTAGTNITISGSTISAKDTTYTAGENITIESTGVDDYTLLEYIQSSGTQYIDTGISGLDSGNWVIYVKWMQTAAPTTSYSYIAGAYNSESHNAYRIITKQTSASGYYVNGNSAAGSGSVLADNYAANVVHQGYIRNGSVTIDSTTYSTPTQGTAIPSGVHIFLLGSSTLGKTTCKLYESWATQNGVEKYHFYPAIRNSDSAVGVYDTVGQRFIAGSGTFAAGPVKGDGFVIKGKNWSVANLTDTEITSATNGDLLQFDGSKWTNAQITVSPMTGATETTDGVGGGVPAPLAGQQNNVLKGDGTWGVSYHPDLFDFKWADHELNDVQWLRADTFSWQSGSVYEAAFNDLFNDIYISTSWRATGYANVYTASPTPEAGDTVYSDSACTTSVGTVTSYDSVNNQMEYNSVTWDYNSNSYVTPVSETVAGYSVDVYTGHSGKKIVSWQDESDVASIYSATGVAWYYIIDIANKRFKLPRVNPDREILLASSSVALSATGTLQIKNASDGIENVLKSPSGDQNGRRMLVVDASSTSQNNVVRYGGGVAGTADLAGASGYYKGHKHLYFYVGEFTQTALENTAGITAAELNAKVDITSSWGAPTSTYDDLTVGASGATYTAPADGWVTAAGQATGNGGNISLQNQTAGGLMINSLTGQANGWGLNASIPVRKGDVFSLHYNGANVNTFFRFIYAQKNN